MEQIKGQIRMEIAKPQNPKVETEGRKKPTMYITRKALTHPTASYSIDGQPVSAEQWVDFVETKGQKALASYAKTTVRFIAITNTKEKK